MSTTYDQHGERVSKAEVRRWMKRVREDLRDLEAALKADDWDNARLCAEDLDPAGGEIRYRVELLADNEGGQA